MNHTYQITGMTCEGCKNSVEENLSSIEGIKSVSVNLEKGTADVEMEHHVSTATLKKALPSKYQLTELVHDTIFNKVDKPVKKSKWKQLQPLFLIFSYLIIASILLNYKESAWQSGMLDFMGLFYIVFSFFKFLDLKGFPESFRMYDPLAQIIPFYGWIYPFLELGLGLMFLMRWQIPLALVITLVVLGITTIGVTKSLVDKKSIKCACLGTVMNLPMTEATFIENAIMIAMAVIMLMKGGIL